jgi:outer membrane protein assembly factor BamB
VTDSSVYVPSADLHGLTPDGDEQWIFETAKAVESKPIADDALYFTHSATIQAVEFDGTALWQLPWEYHGAPYPLTTTETSVYASGTVGVGAEADFQLAKVDAGTGQVQWTAEIGSRADAVVRDGTIYIASPNSIMAFATSDGTKRWEASYEGVRPKLAGILDGTVVVYGDDVYGFSTADGALEWTVGDDGDVDGGRNDDLGIVNATVRDEQVLVATEQDFRALSTADGQTRWQTTAFDGMVRIHDLGENQAFLSVSSASTPDTLVSVRLDDGTVEWSWSDGKEIQEAIRYDSGILVRGETNLRTLDLAGREQWRFDFGISISSPTVKESSIYVGTRAMDESDADAPTVPGTMYGIKK